MPARRLLTAGGPWPLAIGVSVSRGGLPTRIVALVDQVGQLAGLARALGSSHELITDQAYDTNAALALLAERNIAAVIRYRPVGTGRRRTGLTLACTECVIW